MGGEDFAVYLQQIPGAFVSIGSNSPYGLHHPAFNPDEALIEPLPVILHSLRKKPCNTFNSEEVNMSATRQLRLGTILHGASGNMRLAPSCGGGRCQY